MQVEERVLTVRPKTILTILGIILAVAAVLELILIARQVLTWILIALFLALALNPLVEWLVGHGVRRRVVAIGITYLAVIGVIAGIAAVFLPTLIGEVNDLIDATPGYVEDLTKGRGPLGFLERDYHIVERVRDALENGGAGKILGYSGTALAVTKGVVTAVIATITIAVLTFFMLLEGENWIDRTLGLLKPQSRERWAPVLHQIYRTVGGYVTGALTIALVAGITAAVLLSVLSVPYAIALALLVAVLDLIPLAGATAAAVIVTTIAFLSSSVAVGIVVLVYFIVYQQVENHFLYPLIYSRTVQLSPLAILIAVLIGASVAGILGALAAIPVAGAIQVVLVETLRQRRVVLPEGVEAPPVEEPAAET